MQCTTIETGTPGISVQDLCNGGGTFWRELLPVAHFYQKTSNFKRSQWASNITELLKLFNDSNLLQQN